MIGSNAFESTKLQSVVIPDSVTSIGYSAFQNCTSLKSVHIGSGVTEWQASWDENHAFDGCTLLTEVTIAEGVTQISAYAFCGCTLLTDMALPSTVTEVGNGAFKDCELLTSADVWGSVGNAAFQNCTSLANITMHNAERIGNSAFQGTTTLATIELPGSLTSIGENAFEGCAKLTGIAIPDSVGYVGPYAFANDTQLTSAVLGAGITEWGHVVGRERGVLQLHKSGKRRDPRRMRVPAHQRVRELQLALLGRPARQHRLR